MSIVTPRTRVVTHHEWVVPLHNGRTAVGDFLDAVNLAMNRYQETFGAGTVHDDWAYVTHEDDVLIVGFTTSEDK